MNKEKIEELIVKYNEGQADPAELKLIEQLIEADEIELDQLHELHQLDEQLLKLEVPSPTGALDDRFYEMLTRMKREAHGFSWRTFFAWPKMAPRLALASLVLMAGFFIGYLSRPAGDTQQVDLLNQQVYELKEMMMLSLLQKESATERLRAVSLTQEMDQVSSKVTNALFETLENDPNVNVRLSALEAIKPYISNDSVRQKLVQSIGKQESPLVQVALADLMVAIQEKSSVKELRKILENDSTPDEVKKRIEENIKVMI